MKILSIQNQKLQNSNNRPINFSGFKSVVVAGDSIDIGRFMAVALKLTDEDLVGFRDMLKEFRNPRLDADVLSIRAECYAGDATEDVYHVFVNGHDFFDSNKELGLWMQGKSSNRAGFKEKLKELLARLRGEKNLDVPKKKAEKEKMLQALSGGQAQSQEEIITTKGLRNSILERLHTVISEDGRVFNVESLNP